MKKGVWLAAGSYLLWGFFPIYFKTLQSVSAFQIVAHRIVWCFLFLLVIIRVRKEGGELRASMTPRILLAYLGAGVLLAINWGVYVWAVNAGFVIESSLGYFINPLVTVLLGVIFLGERLRTAQWVPVVLAGGGVAFLTISYGSPPWISLLLAFSFGLYGLTKKLAPLGSLHGLVLETGAIFLPALLFLIFVETRGTGSFGHAGMTLNLLMALTGVVTAIPLLLFSAGAQSIPMSTLGLLQYMTPTIQFFLGVFLYHEPFPPAQLIGFSIIWAALILFSSESYMNHRKDSQLTAAEIV